MNQEERKNRRSRESDYYEAIKVALEEIIRKRLGNVYLEITASKKFSNKLKAEIGTHRDIIFHFLREAAPDITGFIKGQYSSDFIVVEIKDDPLRIEDVYQARKYAELFGAKYALLVSTQEVPEELKRLAKVVYQLLSGGAGYERLALAHFDADKMDFIEWHDRNPFEKANP